MKSEKTLRQAPCDSSGYHFASFKNLNRFSDAFKISFSLAKSKGVSSKSVVPHLFVAPIDNKYFKISVSFACKAARCKAVFPSLFFAFISISNCAKSFKRLLLFLLQQNDMPYSRFLCFSDI